MEEFSLLLRSHSEEKARELLQERYSLSGSQKPFLVLHEGVNDRTTQAVAKKRKRTGKRNKSAFSRQLQEFVRHGDRRYATYEAMHELWSGYISNIVGTAKGPAVLQAVLSADWHGAILEVESARNPSLVGVAGILLWESRSQWLVVTQSSGFKQVPKRGTVVELRCSALSVLIVGDRVLCRNTERTGRKFKPHEISKIAPLLQALLMAGPLN